MSFIDIKNLIFKYKTYIDEKDKVEKTALEDINISVKKGDFVAFLGANGSGKSTLAKQISAMLFPSEGIVLVKGMDTKREKDILNIRRTAGIVFQNPDNQIIGNTVEEDVAFGPENLGISQEEMIPKIAGALESTGMTAYRSSSPNRLSGGQKQRVAISGILAMEPECIILDEPTAMLDPKGREDVLQAVRYLNKEKGITILYITHHIEEVLDADYYYVMDQGKIHIEGKKEEVMKRHSLEDLNLDLPFIYKLKNELEKYNIIVPDDISQESELISFLENHLKRRKTDV